MNKTLQILLLTLTGYAYASSVGDRVQLTVNHPDGNSSLVSGDQGTVVCLFQPSEGYTALVMWDKANIGHNGFGTCANKTSQGRGWAVYNWQVQKLSSGTVIGPPAPSSGQYSRTAGSNSIYAYFLNCGSNSAETLGICLPVFYQWSGLLIVKYDASGSYVTVKQIDQSVTMTNVRDNPCGVNLSVYTDVYDNGGQRYITSVRPSRPGSYLYSSTSINYGGVTDWSIGLTYPLLVARGVAAGSECTGFSSLAWSTQLPYPDA
jgi:hypothetical protein